MGGGPTKTMTAMFQVETQRVEDFYVLGRKYDRRDWSSGGKN